MRAVEVLSNGVERGRRVKSQAEFRGRGVLIADHVGVSPSIKHKNPKFPWIQNDMATHSVHGCIGHVSWEDQVGKHIFLSKVRTENGVVTPSCCTISKDH